MRRPEKGIELMCASSIVTFFDSEPLLRTTSFEFYWHGSRVISIKEKLWGWQSRFIAVCCCQGNTFRQRATTTKQNDETEVELIREGALHGLCVSGSFTFENIWRKILSASTIVMTFVFLQWGKLDRRGGEFRKKINKEVNYLFIYIN